MDANEQYQNELRDRQALLEQQQKAEEDALFKKFEAERREAATEASKETGLEWESKLKGIIAMLEKNNIDETEFEKVTTSWQCNLKLFLNPWKHYVPDCCEACNL